MTYMDHDAPYPDAYLNDILSSVKTIAMVGASPDKTKFSYGVLRVLSETGYDMIPINPRTGLEEIRGLKVYPSLEAIDRPVDMVEVFRRPRIYWESLAKRLPSRPKCFGGKLVCAMMTPRGLPKTRG